MYKIVTPENRESLELRLLRNSLVTDSGCREWLGKPNTYGYGRMWVDGRRPFYVHQIAFELWCGPITQESIDHLCSNRMCIEGEHLDQCSKGENTRGGLDKRRPTLCPQGHEYTKENVYVGPLRSDSGVPIKYCRVCHREQEQERRDAKRLGMTTVKVQR